MTPPDLDRYYTVRWPHGVAYYDDDRYGGWIGASEAASEYARAVGGTKSRHENGREVTLISWARRGVRAA